MSSESSSSGKRGDVVVMEGASSSGSWAFKKASELTTGVSLSGLIRYRLGLSDKSDHTVTTTSATSVESTSPTESNTSSGDMMDQDSPAVDEQTEALTAEQDSASHAVLVTGGGTAKHPISATDGHNDTTSSTTDGHAHETGAAQTQLIDQGDSDTDSQRSTGSSFRETDTNIDRLTSPSPSQVQSPIGIDDVLVNHQFASSTSAGSNDNITNEESILNPTASLSSPDAATPERVMSVSQSNTSLYDTLVGRGAAAAEASRTNNNNNSNIRNAGFAEPSRENPASASASADSTPSRLVTRSISESAATATRPRAINNTGSESAAGSSSIPGTSSARLLASTSAGSVKTTTLLNSSKKKHPFSIRLTPFVDHSTVMPSQYIGIVERKSRQGTVIKIGRYSDRREADEKATSESSPIVFKSKVVSRSHAELFVSDGNWFIRDVKSSSGTFLNHLRLSPACEISEPHLLNDGDLLQLGMDFRGGSEELYKCIKVRVELNRSWQKRVNEFNTSALEAVRQLHGANQEQSSGAEGLQECAICLLPVSTCQALFVAPCSHGWHYKCIRPLVVKTYPHFLCPNCRSICDLEADLEARESSDDSDAEEDEDDAGDTTAI